MVLRNQGLDLIKDEQLLVNTRFISGLFGTLTGFTLGYLIGGKSGIGGIIAATIIGPVSYLVGDILKPIGKKISPSQEEDSLIYDNCYDTLADYVLATEAGDKEGLSELIEEKGLSDVYCSALILDYLIYTLEEKNYSEVSRVIADTGLNENLARKILRNYMNNMAPEELSQNQEHLEKFFRRAEWQRMFLFYLNQENIEQADHALKKAKFPSHERKCYSKRLIGVETKVLGREDVCRQ